MAKGKRVAGSEYDQTYLDTETSIQVHRDYAAHYFRWGWCSQFMTDKLVLDAGCGPNFMAGRVATDHGRMSHRPLHYVGVDLSPLPVVRTQHKTLIGEFDVVNRTHELVEFYGKFDLITSFEVIEHMPKELGVKYLDALVGALAPGGQLILSTPHNKGARFAKNHIHEWGGLELEEGFKDAGLKVVRKHGTYADVKQIEKAAREKMPEVLVVKKALEGYYSNDILSCIFAPAFPEFSKNIVWVCEHQAPEVIDPGPERKVPVAKWPGEHESQGQPDLELETDIPGRAEDKAAYRTAVVNPTFQVKLRPEEETRSEATDEAPVAEVPRVDPPAPQNAEEDDQVAPYGNLLPGPLPDTTVINTYAGSLLLGAQAIGAPVTRSLEDCGFGAAWQKANFPEIPRFEKRAAWPEVDFSDQVVIAHPPCAAFSVQAIGTRKKAGVVHGLENPAFKETIDVLEYAMEHRAMGIAVESVQGACEGAAPVHDALAEKHGYHVYRILQNSATFGVPQWRPRFWALFMRKDLGDRFAAYHSPTIKSVSDVLESLPHPGPADEGDVARVARQRALLEENLGTDVAAEIMSTPGVIAQTIHKRDKSKDLMADISGPLCVGASDNPKKPHNPKMKRFMSKIGRVLDPDMCATVLLKDTLWIYKGRAVTPAQYRALMGFPHDYILDKDYKMWLSKGVVPAVAAWVLQLLRVNAARQTALLPDTGVRWLNPGETVDFQITKTQFKELREGGATNHGHTGSVQLPAPSTDGEQPAKVDKPKAAKKKRAIHPYILEDLHLNTLDDIKEAFVPSRELVCEPLKEITELGDGKVQVVVQYEPPNAGGGRHDTDRLVKRAAKKLICNWRRA